MEFGSNREGFCEEEHQSSTTGKPKLHFSYNSSSSSPSSSSSQYKTTQHLGPSPSNNNRQQMGCWLGSKYHPADEEASTNKLDLMEEDVRSASTISNIEKEHMFDKVVTPSDVGKLNRLVIPKQHAEKFFPLDSSANEKGLLLNFEDRNGKPWRFRYSYWNSSQSYVMTKGWSRFVKDKKLDAGDIVSFQRGVGDLARDRLYIDWRRRPDAPEPSSFPLQHHLSFHRSIPWSPMLMRPPPAPVTTRDHLHMSQMNHFLNRNGYYDGGGGGGNGGYGYGYGSGSNNVMNPCHMGSVFYLRSQPLQSQPLQEQMGMSMGEWQSHHHQYQHQQQQENTMVFDSVPVVQGKAAAKRLRLFGVNMDCPISETSTTTDDDECDIVLSSTTLQHAPIMPTIQHHNHHHQLSSSSSSHSQAAAPLQLRLYNGTSMPPPIDFLNKGKASMS